MLIDKNGIELKTGQIVKIEGGFFKADNGLFRISHSPNDENWSGSDYCLKKVNKRDFSDSTIKYNLGFWPLMVTVNSREKSIEAKEHNKNNATIEVIGAVKTYKIKTIGDRWNREVEQVLYCTESELEEIKQQERTQIEILEVGEEREDQPLTIQDSTITEGADQNMETNIKYTIETLKEIKLSHDMQYRISESDVEKVNKFIELIENSRDSTTPMIGDTVEFTDKHGEYYNHAHIEKIENDMTGNAEEIYICESPYIPFIDLYNDNIYTSTSGGAWQYIPKNLKLIGQRTKLFNVWGWCGACGNGAIQFEALVNVWEYKELNNIFPEHLSTKTHDKFYVYIKKDDDFTSNYKYRIETKGMTNHTAFKTDKEYKAWLKTFNGLEFKGHWENQLVVWTDKQIEKCIPLEEYLKIENCVIDSTLCNAEIQECKRIYTDNTVTTYLPYQNNSIPLEGVTVSHMKAYFSL
jgi:hypothetical protein